LTVCSNRKIYKLDGSHSLRIRFLRYRGACNTRAEIKPVEPVRVMPAKGAIDVRDRVPPFAALFGADLRLRRNARRFERTSLSGAQCCRREPGRRDAREFRITLDPAQVRERFISAYRQGLGVLREIEAVADIARRYRGKVPMAVASGGARDIVEATLCAARLFDLFDPVVTIEDVAGCGKPAPDLFLRAALRLRVSPAAGTAFEDSNEGIEAACRAGMTAIDVRLICRFA
jgi:beta-phosphoglucomutase-like phosphatase (HAD superfamily)